MTVTCPSCSASVETINSRSTRWCGESDSNPLATILREAGLTLVEDWVHCPHCGYNGSPQFSRDDATAFVHALEREAVALALQGEWERARLRYVRALAIFPDYSPALAALASTFIDAPDADAAKAEGLLVYANTQGRPRMPHVDWLLGRLFVRLGRSDRAHYYLARYIDRDRAATDDNPFPNYPSDATDKACELLTGLIPPWVREKLSEFGSIRDRSFHLALTDTHCATDNPFRQALVEFFGTSACVVYGHGVAQLSPRPFGTPYADPETGKQVVTLIGNTPDDVLVALPDDAFAVFRAGTPMLPGSYLCRVVDTETAWQMRVKRTRNSAA